MACIVTYNGKTPRIGKGAFIAPTAALIGDVEIGARALIAAGTVVLEGQEIPAECLAAGAPAKIKKKLEGAAAKWIEVSADAYSRLTRTYRAQGIGVAEEEL